MLIIKNNLYKKLFALVLFSICLQSFIVPLNDINFKLHMFISPLVFFIIIFDFKISVPLFLYEKLLLFFYFYISLSIFYAENKLLSLKAILLQVIILITYFLLRLLVKRVELKQIERIIISISIIFILLSTFYYLYGLYNIYFLSSRDIYVYGVLNENMLLRFRGIVDSPNNYILFGSFFMFFLLFKKKNSLAIIYLITLFLTFSITYYIIFIISFFIIALFSKKYYYLIASTLLCVALYGLIHYLVINNDLAFELVEWRINRALTGSGRFDLWSYSFDKILESPYLGIGLNQTRDLISDFEVKSLHNTFLEILLTSGIGGFIVYILFQISLFMYAIKLTKKYKNEFFLLLYVVFFIVSLANNIVQTEYLIIYLITFFIYLNSWRAHSQQLATNRE